MRKGHHALSHCLGLVVGVVVAMVVMRSIVALFFLTFLGCRLFLFACSLSAYALSPLSCILFSVIVYSSLIFRSGLWVVSSCWLISCCCCVLVVLLVVRLKDEYGYKYPCVKARGIIDGSAEDVMGMIVDSTRVSEYNRCVSSVFC